jgi:hypothetical protein
MVTNDLQPEVADSRERAQLILVGSIAIAFVVIGLVVVINTVLFTENVATSESIERSGSAENFDYQARRDTRSLVLRINHGTVNVTRTDLRTAIQRNVTNFSRILSESYADRSGAWVNVTYNPSKTRWGERIVRERDGTFVSPNGDADWAVVDDTTDAEIGRVIMNMNVSETSEAKQFSVNVSNATGYVNLSMSSVGPSPNANLTVNPETSLPSRGVIDPSAEECEPSNGRVLLDLKTGNAFTGSCAFNGTAELEPPYNVTFTDGTAAHGKFGLVLNETNVDYSGGSYAMCKSSGDDICVAPVAWSANVTFQYQTRTINYTRDSNVTIYP